MKKKYDNRYMRNHEVATRVARDMFAGSTLHGFDPDWSFNVPIYMEGHAALFNLPDWAVGLLAERLGLSWEWGEGTENHPIEQMKKYFTLLKKRVKETQDELNLILDKALEVD